MASIRQCGVKRVQPHPHCSNYCYLCVSSLWCSRVLQAILLFDFAQRLWLLNKQGSGESFTHPASGFNGSFFYVKLSYELQSESTSLNLLPIFKTIKL